MGAIMATYEILNDSGDVINTIIADASFVEQAYPGHYREVVPPAPDFSAANKQQATELLQATDWTELPSVSDVTDSPYLVNVADFLTYRTALRGIAVNPPATPVDPWPIKPVEQWSN